jgi:hypothetical protein
MEALGWGLPSYIGDLPLWVAAPLVWGGAALLAAAVWINIFPFVIRFLPLPLGAPEWAWNKLAWAKYKPSVTVQPPANITYDTDNGNLSRCELSFQINVTAHYPYGETTIGSGQSFLVVRCGEIPFFQTKHRFRVKAHLAAVPLQRGAGTHPQNLWFESEVLGRPAHNAPDLKKSFHWKIYRLGATFYGTRSFMGIFRPFKGYVEGKE